MLQNSMAALQAYNLTTFLVHCLQLENKQEYAQDENPEKQTTRYVHNSETKWNL